MPFGETSRAQMLWEWPSRSRSALSPGVDLGFLTSIMVSLPPETIRPSGYSGVGGMYATELMYSWPLVTRVSSYVGGLEEDFCQTRTVLSRETETTVSGLGKATPRTLMVGRGGQQGQEPIP